MTDRGQMMWDFALRLEEEVVDYDGEYEELVREAPAAYRLLTGLLEDPDLPTDRRQDLLAAVAYFILPFDAIPEDLHGPWGYLDDLFLSCRVAEDVAQQAGWEIVERNWSGEMGSREFVERVLENADGYMEEPNLREQIFEYVGYDTRSDGEASVAEAG